MRFTEDIDPGVVADHSVLNLIVTQLKESGFEVEYRRGDTDDPLAGLIDITGSFGMVQIVNFHERFPTVIGDAYRSSILSVRDGSLLKIVPLSHLIALKLYAGGFKSEADILELLRRNPDVDLESIQSVCNQYRMRGLDEIVAEL